MSASDLVARLAKEGIDPMLLAEVAQELFAGEVERKALEARRKNERERKASQRASRDVTGQRVTSGDIPPNERDNLTPREELPQEAKASLPQGAKTRDSVAWPCPAGVSPRHWNDFVANRKRKRCVQTQTALDGVLSDIAKIADDEWPPGRLVEHAAAKGWASINDPRESKYGERPNGERKRSGWETAFASNVGALGHQ